VAILDVGGMFTDTLRRQRAQDGEDSAGPTGAPVMAASFATAISRGLSQKLRSPARSCASFA
jgi:hypothetical protein